MDVEEPGRDDQELFFEKLQTFVVGHETSVLEMIKTFDGKQTTAWDARTDTITMDLSLNSIDHSVADTLGHPALHNALFHRTVIVLVSTKIELRALIDECHETLIPPLALFGDGVMHDDQATRGLGRLVTHLMDVWNWLRRARRVVHLCVQQLGSLYDETHEHDKFAPYQRVSFRQVWFTLFELLGAVATLEEMFVQHDVMHRASNTLKRIMANVKKHPDRFEDANTDFIEQYGKLLTKLENDLMKRQMLKSIAQQGYDSGTDNVRVHTNASLFNQTTKVFTVLLASVKRAHNTIAEGPNRLRVISVCASFVWYCSVFGSRLAMTPTALKDLTQEVYNLHKLYSVVPILGATSFKTGHWLARHLPSGIGALTKDPIVDSMTAIQNECPRDARIFIGSVHRAGLFVTGWVAQFQATYPNDRPNGKKLLAQTLKLIRQGISHAQELLRGAQIVLAVHETADLSVKKDTVLAVFQAVQLLCLIRSTFHNKTAWLTSMAPIMMDHLAFQMKKTLYEVYQKLTLQLQQGAVNGVPLRAAVAEAKTDQQCALGQALYLLSRPLSPQNLQCLDIVLSIAFNREEADLPVTPEAAEEVFHIQTALREFCDFQKLVSDFTNCDFLYWQRDSCLPIFFSAFYRNPQCTDGFLYLIHVLHDSIPMLLSAKHLPNAAILVENFEKHVEELIRTEIVEKLVTEIEEDLRLHAHATVLGQPYRPQEGIVRKLVNFANLSRFRFFGKFLELKAMMEDVLDVTFYNHNALNPNDWNTYEQMRTLAKERFNLTIADGFLPGWIVDQGLDVLMVTKNIHFFVANFTYNLNEQLFVQRPTVTDAKRLSTLHIRHIANSIRTHGTGIMNTTVNYVYKCLLKKLSVISQFLYDDHIKSKLLRDIKWFTVNKNEINGRYPVGRIEKFVQDIRKLGVTDDNRSFLDQVRQLVSEIGNALGYMRMVRSGGLRSLSDAAACVPDIESIPFLTRCLDPNAVRPDEEPPEEEVDFQPQVSAPTSESVAIIDEVVSNMTKRLAQGSDYFRMLEEAISKKLSDSTKYGHLKNFYMLVPAMTVSFVEMMIHQKERLMKKNKEGLFTDDGFALGCVFLLSLFRCEDKFDSLHWFESVTDHFLQKRQQTKTDLSTKKKDEPRRDDGDWLATQTMQLTLTMVEASLSEYMSVQYGFNCCRVFFKHRDPLKFDSSSSDSSEDEAEDD